MNKRITIGLAEYTLLNGVEKCGGAVVKLSTKQLAVRNKSTFKSLTSMMRIISVKYYM